MERFATFLFLCVCHHFVALLCVAMHCVDLHCTALHCNALHSCVIDQMITCIAYKRVHTHHAHKCTLSHSHTHIMHTHHAHSHTPPPTHTHRVSSPRTTPSSSVSEGLRGLRCGWVVKSSQVEPSGLHWVTPRRVTLQRVGLRVTLGALLWE